MITKNLILINLKHQRIIEQRKAQVIIDEERGLLSYLADFTSEEPINQDDEAMGWEERHRYYDITVKRSTIGSVEIYLLDGKIWTVSVNLNNGEDLRLYFKYKEKASAIELANDLVKFMTNGV